MAPQGKWYDFINTDILFIIRKLITSHYHIMSESKLAEGGYIIGDVPMVGLRNSFFPARKECEC